MASISISLLMRIERGLQILRMTDHWSDGHFDVLSFPERHDLLAWAMSEEGPQELQQRMARHEMRPAQAG